jgi:hypothetical protein|tara:strand:+ start:427 stop:1257 length:831 start_codon:yes stop_codon:yes gene_type:complete
VRIPITVVIGVVLVIVGVIGLTVIFPNFMATNGQDFVDQIDTSSGLEKYQDYGVGDTVTIVDTIARMEFSDGQTQIWLDTIGKSPSDPPFRFGSNLMGDYGVGNQVIITFEVVKDSSGHHTPDANYQENGLSPDAISSRYSTVNEYIFIVLLVAGLGIMVYGGYSSFKGGSPTVMEPDDDWGFPQAPPVAPAAPMTSPQPQFPPSTAAIPQSAPTSPPPQPVPQPAGAPSTMTITVPPGVVAGQVLTVTMPNGQVVNVEVPPGSSSGSQFTITVKQ